jgi:hypothetical protein
VLLNGLFEIDLTSAANTPGDAWALVTAANVTYGSTFAVAGFGEIAPGVWENGDGYRFSESTGLLTAAVPEPAALAAAGAAALLLGRRRRVG